MPLEASTPSVRAKLEETVEICACRAAAAARMRTVIALRHKREGAVMKCRIAKLQASNAAIHYWIAGAPKAVDRHR